MKCTRIHFTFIWILRDILGEEEGGRWNRGNFSFCSVSDDVGWQRTLDKFTLKFMSNRIQVAKISVRWPSITLFFRYCLDTQRSSSLTAKRDEKKQTNSANHSKFPSILENNPIGTCQYFYFDKVDWIHVLYAKDYREIVDCFFWAKFSAITTMWWNGNHMRHLLFYF